MVQKHTNTYLQLQQHPNTPTFTRGSHGQCPNARATKVPMDISSCSSKTSCNFKSQGLRYKSRYSVRINWIAETLSLLKQTTAVTTAATPTRTRTTMTATTQKINYKMSALIAWEHYKESTHKCAVKKTHRQIRIFKHRRNTLNTRMNKDATWVLWIMRSCIHPGWKQQIFIKKREVNGKIFMKFFCKILLRFPPCRM